MLHTKADFISCLWKIINPLKKYYTKGCAGIKCGNSGVSYGEKIALMEGFSRLFWGLAPLWAGGHNSDGFDDLCLEGIINGTNPEHEEYWGKICDGDQKMVEAAALGLALAIAPHKVWDPLTQIQKKNFEKWISQMNVAEACANNWKLFAVIVNLGLKNVGCEYSREVIEHGISCINSYYRSDGWYHDGNTDQADYYIAFAIHFYSLIYAKIMEKDDLENSRIFKERATLFARDFIYWFASDGSALAFGRSLTYRFAQCCFWSACVFADIKPFSMGVMKGLISRNIEWWMSKPIFDNGGVLTIGYEYPNLNMSEFYNGFGSPFWALKSFLILALDDNHEFFKVSAEPLPKLDSIRVMPHANMTIQHFGKYMVALTAGQWALWEPTHCAEKYSKFAYSSKYAFSVPRAMVGIPKAGTDSMLAFEIDSFIYVRRKCERHCIDENGVVYSKWSPYRGIEVETWITPTDDGHIRKHKIYSSIECIAYDCAFAVPDKNYCDINSNAETIVIRCDANTNLANPSTGMNATKYTISKGENVVKTKITYPL